MADKDNNPDFHKQTTAPILVGEEKSLTPEKIPQVIGPYRIESLLEKGGMSFVYLGTHPETKDPITIKVLSPKYLSNSDVVARFLKEAEIIAMADHPNIVKLYAHDKWEGGLYIAMEFIEGVSLRHHLQHHLLSSKRALEIILEISYALCHLHTHGIIHRDLKLENILVTTEGRIKVIDFGIAQLLTEKGDDTTPSKQRLMGTPIYMSPEQRQNPESVSYPSDIYSLGIIAYELILGKLSHGQVHLSLAPKGLQKILSKALQPNPEDRYQDVVDFITDISSYLHSDTLQKEKKGVDQLSELSEHLQHAQTNLLTPPCPTWPQIEIGLLSHKGIQITGVYYDFFPLPHNAYGILMAESSAKGAEGIAFTAVLRGMVKALSRLTSKPVELVTVLNDLAVQDPSAQIFSLQYLILSPDEHLFHYVSCGYGSLWHIAHNNHYPKKITSNNPSLGHNAHAEFQEISHPWNVDDILLMNSSSPFIPKTSNEEKTKRLLLEYRELPIQKQVETLFRKMRTLTPKAIEENSLCLIGVHLMQELRFTHV